MGDYSFSSRCYNDAVPLLWLSLAYTLGVLLGAAWGGWWAASAAMAAALAVLAVLCRWLRGSARFGLAQQRWQRGRLRLGVALPRLIGSAWGRRMARWQPLGRELLSIFPPLRLPFILLLIALFLGLARVQAATPRLSTAQVGYYASEETRYVVEGWVSDDPEGRDGYTNARLRVERLHPTGELGFTAVSGDVLARLPHSGDWRYGDRLRLTGYLQSPTAGESFDYQDYLHKQGISLLFSCGGRGDEACAVVIGRQHGFSLYAAIFALRSQARQALTRLLPDPEASLLSGILLGVESRIPQAVQHAFQDTGTSHIIAISGYNFAIVAALLTALFGRLLGRWRGMAAAFVGIAVYAALAGAGAGVVRAAVMGVIGVFGAQIGRRQVGVNSLVVTAGVMAVYDPWVLWDLSFQLSFAATMGLILYATPLQARFTAWATGRFGAAWADRLAAPVSEFVLITMAAQVTTLPLMLYRFQRLSLSSLLVNPLVLPAQAPVMLFGGLAALLGIVWPWGGQLAAWAVWPFLAYTIRVIEWFAALPLSSMVLPPIATWLLLSYYLALAAATAYAPLLRRHIQPQAVARWGMIGAWGLSLAAVAVWKSVFTAPDGRLHLTVLDVSANGRSGQALLITTAQGRHILIDGGPSPSALADALGRRLPPVAQGFDAWVIATSSDDSLAALPETLARYAPSQTIWAAPPLASYSARLLHRRLDEAGVPQTTAQPGQSFDLGGGARLEFLVLTRRGAVLWLECDRFRALLPLGLDFDTLAALPQDGPLPDISALLLAESGYAPLAPPQWLAYWQPQAVLLSVSPGDSLFRPEPVVLEALEGYNLLRTDHNGWIDLATDGRQMWVTVERK